MSSAFDKIGAWTANDEGALAVYEGIDNEESSSGSGGGNSYAYGGKRYTYDADGNIIEDPSYKKQYLTSQSDVFKLPTMPELARSKSKVVPFKIKAPKSPGNNRRIKLKV